MCDNCFLERIQTLTKQRDEYKDLVEGFHEAQLANGWCDCYKGGSEQKCELAKKLEELRDGA